MKTLILGSILSTILSFTLTMGTGIPTVMAKPAQQASSFKPQLWAPDQPVDILVHNPYNEPLRLPQPYTPPSVRELFGPGVTENGLISLDRDVDPLAITILSVGANVTLVITYADHANEGFNDPTLGNDRKTAFEYGVGRWATRLQGPASISIQATMTPHGGTATSAVLASGGPGQVHENFSHAPFGDTYYAEAQVEIISGSDPDSATFDINVDYNSDVDNSTVLGNTDWYYGTDANPGNDIDFATVTIHELCHGLGFVDSFRDTGAFGLGGAGHPLVYDRFLVDGNGTQLISLTPSPNNVTGNNVFWSGLRGRFAFNNDFGGVGNVLMFAPTPFEDGSSISHLDEGTFLGDWDLQTPSYDGAIHTPDSIVMGILQDIGHSLPQSRYVDASASGFEEGSSANPFNTVAEGVADVPTDGFVRILPGSYPETLTIYRSMELHSSGGTATIGAGASSTVQEP